MKKQITYFTSKSKKSSSNIFKIVVILLLIFNTTIQADPFGTLLGSFNGVSCYSNGSTGFVSNMSNTHNGTNTGMKWQCPEICNRIYVDHFQINIRNQPSNNANDYYPTASLRGLSRYPNGSNTIPAVYDLLCFTGGEFGHIAIIRAVGPNYVDIIQQNWFNNSSDVSKRLAMTVSEGSYTIANLSASYPCQGWLRKSSSGFAAVSVGVNVNPSIVTNNQIFTVSFTLTEINGSSIMLDTLVSAILKSNGDLLFNQERRNNVFIAANGIYNYSANSSFFTGVPLGQYTAMARGYKNGFGWFNIQTTGGGINPRNFTLSGVSTINQINNSIPLDYKLYQNFPNPFNPTTEIRFDVPMKEKVNLKIFDITGKEVSELVNENISPGTYKVRFNGSQLNSGIYLYKIVSGDFVETKRMLLIK